MSELNKTSHTLIQRAIDLDDKEAWEQLYTFYHKFIYYLLNQMSISSAQKDDVVQDVMISLMKNLKSYDREKGRFRSWLKMIIRNSALMEVRKQASQNRRLDGLEAEESVMGEGRESEFDSLIDREWKKYVSGIALERIRNSFRGQAVEVFELSLTGMSTEEISAKTGLKHDSIYSLRRRVKRSMVLEVQNIVADLEQL